MIKNLKTRLLNSPEWAISPCVFIVYWLVNKSYTGPGILHDEIGYLANAALISGHIIDGANSWHAGYSFFLAPLFVIFPEPSHIWQAAMVLNASIWAVSFLLLTRILKALMPEISKQQLAIALLISAFYPTWITMSGYVFATTAFVFVYLLSILALLLWKPDKYWTIIPHALLVGYLYWVHPVGIAVCLASLIVVGFVSVSENKYTSALLSIILIAVLIITYNEVVDKWLIMLATPEGYNPLSQHYPGSERIINKLFTYDFWLHLVAKSAGQTSSLIVSSFGLTLFGFITSINKSYTLIKSSKKNIDHSSNLVKQSVFIFLALALLGVLAMGAIFFSGSASRIDHWIYGRYTEMVVLPLLALGCLSICKKKWFFSGALFVFLTGLILYKVADITAENHLMHTVAFWPQYLILESNFLYWMAAGSLVLVLVGRVWNDSRFGNMLILLLVVLCFAISAVVSHLYHHNIVSQHGKPSTYVGLIRENYPPGTCVGFNPKRTDSLNMSQIQTYNLNLFYLYDYTYRRMSPEEWVENCDGPYFTDNLDGLFEQQGLALVGRERFSNIYLLAKEGGKDMVLLDISKSGLDIYPTCGWEVDYTISYEGSQLAEVSGPVGYYQDGSIYSKNADGFVMMDSGTRLGSGKYNFALKGEASLANGSFVDIISRSGKAEHGKFDVRNNPESNNEVIAFGTFLLDEPVHNLEVRVYVDSSDNVRIDGYEIEYISNEEWK